MPHPEGYRKAMRCMRLAAKFDIPVITLSTLQALIRDFRPKKGGRAGRSRKIFGKWPGLPTPIIVILIGEGCSGGALGIGVGDIIGMLEHSYYSVISPEGCASILWKDASKNAIAAAALKMHVEDLLELGIVDQMIAEPLGGAHLDPKTAYSNVKSFIKEQWDVLKTVPIDLLLENRYQKFRKMGKFESRSAAMTATHETSSSSSPSQ